MNSVVLRCLILDDDDVAIKLIHEYINRTDGLDAIATCKSAEDALNELQKIEIDILFLDIELPQMSGIDLLKALDKTPHTIFITSQREYAVDAFDHNAVDFLLKPFDYGRFSKAIGRARERLIPSDPAPTEPVISDSVFVRHNSKYVKVPIDEILWIEAVGDYANLYTHNRRYTIHTTMKALQKKLLPNEFIRVHRSYIVRIARIEEIEDNTLSLGEGKLVPIGKRYRGDLLQALNMI